MKFSEIIDQASALLQRKGRITYRALKLEFALNDEQLDVLKEELIDGQELAVDKDGKTLVWVDASPVQSSEFQVPSSQASNWQLETRNVPPFSQDSGLSTQHLSGERRQLTVMFCDLVDSTTLSTLLDLEELREVVHAYHQTCAGVISRYGGHTAQHLGDGLLVYFGYPAAHEDDAQRAVRTGLEILAGLPPLNAQLPSAIRARLPHPLQVRIGIHTGLVVIGEIGSADKHEILALGETPNIAARVQGQAEPDTVVISGATYHLVQGLFECQDRGPQELKGISTPLPLYRVVRESAAQSRFEVAIRTGLTPLVGRAPELGLLRQRWEHAKAGAGQVVLLSGEPGIGKSRLVQELKEQFAHEGVTRIEFRCSPYHQNSVLYPIIDHLQRLLGFQSGDSPEEKLRKLEVGARRAVPLQLEAIPLLAALLSLPHPEGYPPITVSPQKQKQKTQEALVAWLMEEAEKAAVYCAWEDVHWADPSTLEVLNLVVDQAPTARLYVLLTFRPEFLPPWGNRSHLSQLTLSRLGRSQVEALVERVTGGKALPSEVVQQIVAKTDGVPLFVEELTKMVVESGVVRAVNSHYELTGPLSALTIPSTLQDSLMARLDRLGTAKEVAQLGATIGREFSYELLQTVSPLDEERLQHGLKRLVEAELVYQRGLAPQAHYLFKHALIQDTAYQSLLKSTRQQYHTKIAQVLEERFTETVETQPELVAHHYTAAGLTLQAIPYWQQAGERATQRSAYVEASGHVTKGLGLLKTLPNTPERTQHELMLQITLSFSLQVTKGYAAPDVEKAFTRARELCQQVGETPQLFSVLQGLYAFYVLRAELQTARKLAEQLLTLAHSVQDLAFLLGAHLALGQTSFFLGQVISAREHLEQAIALYNSQKHRSHVPVYGMDLGVDCLSYAAMALRSLGYPDQAFQRSHEALTLAQELSNPFKLAYALNGAAGVHLGRGEWQAAQERAEALITLCAEQGFPQFLAYGTFNRGGALAAQGHVEEGIVQMQQGLAVIRATGTELGRTAFLTGLAGAYGKAGQAEEGLSALAEALAAVDRTGERVWEAELYRVKGELLQRRGEWVKGRKGEQITPSPAHLLTPSSPEECFLKAIEIARRQSAKSLELRAVMSLSRLWRNQGKQDEARQMLAEIYGWFTEGFDTKDLQEAKALLESLSS